jgi:hypothetical protein
MVDRITQHLDSKEFERTLQHFWIEVVARAAKNHLREKWLEETRKQNV